MRFGIISPPVSGHLNPFGALGRELISRGHRVTIFHLSDLENRARAEGLDFIPLGRSDHPPGSLARSLTQIGKLDGFAALRFTIQAVCKTTEMFCRDGPKAIRDAAIDALLVDQMEPAGATVAEHIGIPFITICNALALNRESCIPPPFTGWKCCDDLWARARNRIGYAFSDRMMRPITRLIGQYREKWNLRPLRTMEDSFSKLAQISQQPEAFDFPRRALPPCFHYVGPLRNASNKCIPFPWEKLNGRPLIYASLGTLQTGKARVFRCFAEACHGLDVQLVITHAGGLTPEEAASLPGNPLVVSYAPQMEVLAKAQLVLCHAGLNTVLDSLAYGVPLLVIPITYEQPAIASRVRWSGAGEVVPFSKLNTQLIRGAVHRLMDDSSYSAKARSLQKSIRSAGGVQKAATLIEGVLRDSETS